MRWARPNASAFACPKQIDFLEDLGHRVDELKNDCLPPDYEDRTRDEPNANVTREDCITTDAEEETTGGPASPATTTRHARW